jgi:hypothetical protein
MPPKIEILVIFQKKNSTCRRSTRIYVHRLDFQYNNLLYVFFIVKKRPLYVNFSIPPCRKWFFSQCSTPLVAMRFWGHVPNSLRNKNMERHIPYLMQKWFFWPSKLWCPLWAQGILFFWSTLNVMILQTVRNEYVRFGGHVDIEVSYKILRLDVLKETSILHNLSCFEAVLGVKAKLDLVMIWKVVQIMNLKGY